MVHILNEESIVCSEDDLKQIVRDNFPDLRKTINTIQKLTNNGKIEIDDSSNVSKLVADLYKLIEHGHVLKCRKLAIKNEHVFNNDYPVLLKEMFNHIDNLDIDEEKKKSQLTTCHDFIYKMSFVMDFEICAYSCFITLSKC
jgi:DNA polymerase III delta prime subunit